MDEQAKRQQVTNPVQTSDQCHVQSFNKAAEPIVATGAAEPAAHHCQPAGFLQQCNLTCDSAICRILKESIRTCLLSTTQQSSRCLQVSRADALVQVCIVFPIQHCTKKLMAVGFKLTSVRRSCCCQCQVGAGAATGTHTSGAEKCRNPAVAVNTGETVATEQNPQKKSSQTGIQPSKYVCSCPAC